MTKDRERLRSDYAAALTAHFGDRARAIARAQAETATGRALEEWTALASLLDEQACSDREDRALEQS